MMNNKKRGLLASAGALVTAVALVLGGAAAAQAAPAKNMPKESGLVITKLEQPKAEGQSATGLPLEGDLPSKTIPGVTFEAYKVTLSGDPLSNAGQQEIAKTTLAEAQTKVAGKSADRSGTTDANGQIRWQTGVADSAGNSLEAGLWLVRETGTPAGVVPAGDFLVAVPLTHPTDRNAWLDTIYAYPKNHTVQGTKTVSNADDLKVGDTVTWTISVDNPSPRDTNTGAYVSADRLEIVDVIKNEQLSTAADGSGVKVVAPASLKAVDDYVVTVADNGDGTTTVTVNFTEAGLAKLVAAPQQQVGLTLDTVVLQAGNITNVANFFSSKTQTDPKPTTEVTVKYGSYALIKKSEGAPEGTKPNLAGAEFMVFASQSDARAAVKGDKAALAKALRPAVDAAGYDRTTGVWTTNADGRVDITGLRYSGFADGKPVTKDEDGYQEYWLVETKALKDHQLLAEPVRFIVDEKSADATTQTTAIVNEYNRGGFVLPLTGGTGTLVLTVAGIALLAVVLLVARRRRNDVAAAE